MKIIFNKKIYDTDQATEITSVRYATPNNLAWFREDLYRSRNGAWFIVGVGGPLSHYAVELEDGIREGRRRLTPMSSDETIAWLEKHGKYSVIEDHFSDWLEIA
ncbi:hypothetical protein FIU86_21415 (plasmid) [Roseovarius sp. THAF9]|uniref:hypothetical protein n=1 Tax=Roseovarius sp. THAF9 TaxID=2587847 RepID=UPI0012695064|nr:hypothetical protein [Roseovarius sp. THAF9]QFT95426.1 hypothetical protein FIU86_21415 [Roseovarius sp. THAF9]